MAINKNKKKITAAKGAAQEKSLGSFELVMDSFKFYFSNAKVFMPLAAAISCFMVPAVFFLPINPQDKSMVYSLYGGLNMLIVMLSFIFYMNVTIETEKKGSGVDIDVDGVVKKTFSGMLWYLWTGFIFLLVILLNIGICVLPAVVAITMLDVGPMVVLVFLIPGFYMFFALFFAPSIAIAGKDSRKNPIKTSWNITKGRMLDIFFAVLAFFLTMIGLAIAYAMAAGLLSLVLTFFLGKISNVLMAAAGVLFMAFLAPVYAVYGYKLYKKFVLFSGEKE